MSEEPPLPSEYVACKSVTGLQPEAPLLAWPAQLGSVRLAHGYATVEQGGLVTVTGGVRVLEDR